MAFGLACVLCVTGSAWAQDAVKLSGFWIDQVTVQSIDGGRVHYQTASGTQVSRPIEALQGLKLGRYPALALAYQAIDRADDPAAADLFEGVYARAGEPWLRGYVGKVLVEVHAGLGDVDRATAVYVDMVTSGAAWSFITKPPTQAVGLALPAEKRRVIELAQAAGETVGPRRAALLEQLIAAAGNPHEAEGGHPKDAGEAAASGAFIVLSASVPPGQIVSLIHLGRFEQAIESADRSMDQPEQTASLLYLKGMARLGIAQRDNDMDTYKSAGLDFMRVLVYFPNSAVLGPATLEAGYVHKMIGRPDIAARLYEKARPLIDQEEDPAYHHRLAELAKAVKAEGQDD